MFAVEASRLWDSSKTIASQPCSERYGQSGIEWYSCFGCPYGGPPDFGWLKAHSPSEFGLAGQISTRFARTISMLTISILRVEWVPLWNSAMAISRSCLVP